MKTFICSVYVYYTSNSFTTEHVLTMGLDQMTSRGLSQPKLFYYSDQVPVIMQDNVWVEVKSFIKSVGRYAKSNKTLP